MEEESDVDLYSTIQMSKDHGLDLDLDLDRVHPLPPGSQLLDTSLLIIARISLVLEGNAGFPAASASGRRPPPSPLP